MKEHEMTGKTSGFGIGMLGSSPATTPYDDMVAAELVARTQPVQKKTGFTAHDVRTNEKYIFDDLHAMITWVKWHVNGSMEQEQFNLSGPGYSVGSLVLCEYGHQLKWRERVLLDPPQSHCNECGGHARNGRCTECGETDMIQTIYHSYVDHIEYINRF